MQPAVPAVPENRQDQAPVQEHWDEPNDEAEVNHEAYESPRSRDEALEDLNFDLQDDGQPSEIGVSGSVSFTGKTIARLFSSQNCTVLQQSGLYKSLGEHYQRNEMFSLYQVGCSVFASQNCLLDSATGVLLEAWQLKGDV